MSICARSIGDALDQAHAALGPTPVGSVLTCAASEHKPAPRPEGAADCPGIGGAGGSSGAGLGGSFGDGVGGSSDIGGVGPVGAGGFTSADVGVGPSTADVGVGGFGSLRGRGGAGGAW